MKKEDQPKPSGHGINDVWEPGSREQENIRESELYSSFANLGQQTKRRVDGEKHQHQDELSCDELGTVDVRELQGPKTGEIRRKHHKGRCFAISLSRY